MTVAVGEGIGATVAVVEVDEVGEGVDISFAAAALAKRVFSFK